MTFSVAPKANHGISIILTISLLLATQLRIKIDGICLCCSILALYIRTASSFEGPTIDGQNFSCGLKARLQNICGVLNYLLSSVDREKFVAAMPTALETQ